MKTHLFRIDCLTDLHVGNGEANYSVIDNEVQKDTVLQDVPVIHASGVKGSIKEHFEHLWGKEDEKIKAVFGDEDNAGQYKFFSALCVARPLRVSNGAAPYILCTGEDILKSFSALLAGLGLGGFYQYEAFPFGGNTFLSTEKDVEIEGEPAAQFEQNALKNLIGPKFAVAKSLRDYALPVRARNVLDVAGQSKNLWYEELVPHESIFYFAVITPDDTCALTFESDRPVQFGGNASIGNGYATITEVFPA